MRVSDIRLVMRYSISFRITNHDYLDRAPDLMANDKVCHESAS